MVKEFVPKRLSQLYDSNITSVGSGDLIIYNGSYFINESASEIGLSEIGHTHSGVYLPIAGGIMTGSIVFEASQTFDGRDLSVDGTKLDGIEVGADVTDATNVDAAGATMNADTDVSGNAWVLDEDNLATNSNTKVPTQQSVKAYVDNVVGSGVVLSEETFTASASQTEFTLAGIPVAAWVWVNDVSYSSDVYSTTGSVLTLDWATGSGDKVDVYYITTTSNYITNPLTTRGDIIYRDASGTTRLPIGTNGQVLTSDGTDVSWEDASGGIGSGDITFENLDANGDVGTGATQVAQGDHNHDSDYADISHTHSGTYLPISGGLLTGSVGIAKSGDNIFHIESTDHNDAGVWLMRYGDVYYDWRMNNDGGELDFEISTNSGSNWTNKIRLTENTIYLNDQTQLENGVAINEFSSDGTLTGSSNSAVPTEAAVKQYVDDHSGGGGDVTKVGTPANNQIGVWTGDGTIEGDSNLTWDGSQLVVIGSFALEAGGIWINEISIDGTMTGSSNTVIPTEAAVKQYVDDHAGGATGSTLNYYTVGQTGSGADYETDGTDDHVQINAAITAANAAGGGIVHIFSGTYTISDEINILSNVIVQGEGRATIITVDNTTDLTELINFGSSNSDAGIRDLTVDGNAENNTNGMNGITLTGYRNFAVNCYVHDIGKNGILTYGGNYHRIEGCEVARCARRIVGDNIIVYDTNHRVSDCIAYDNYDEDGNCFGIYSEATATPDNEVEETVISNCIAYCTGSWGSDSVNGFNFEGSIRATISNSIAHSCNVGLLVLDSSDTGNEPVKNVTITGCLLHSNIDNAGGNGGIGLKIDDGDGITVTNCQILNNESQGIYMQGGNEVFDFILNGCNVSGNGSYGLQTDSSEIGSNWIISNCIFNNNGGRGIDVGANLYVTISGCNISGNSMGIEIGGNYSTISGCKIYGNSQQGINLDAGSGHNVTGCHIYNNGYHGIEVDTNDVNITGNYIDGNDSTSGGYAGIRTLNNRTYINIVGNTIIDSKGTATQDYGVRLGTGNDYVNISNNIFRGNTTNPTDGSVGANGQSINNIGS